MLALPDFPILSAFLSALATEGSQSRRRALDARQAASCARFHPSQPIHAPDHSRGGEGVTGTIRPERYRNERP